MESEERKDFRPVMKRGEILKYTKIYEVKDPEYGTRGSVGIDFFMPKFTDMFLTELVNKNRISDVAPIMRIVIIRGEDDKPGYVVIPTHGDILIPTGIKVKLPKDTALLAVNKSGIAMKKKLIRGAELIDWDYQGVIHCHLINTSDTNQVLYEGEKMIQFVMIPTLRAKICEVKSSDELYQGVSERGDRGFGEGTGKI